MLSKVLLSRPRYRNGLMDTYTVASSLGSKSRHLHRHRVGVILGWYMQLGLTLLRFQIFRSRHLKISHRGVCISTACSVVRKTKAMFHLCLRTGFMSEIVKQSFGASCSEKLVNRALWPGRSSPVRNGFCVGAAEDWNARGMLSGYRIVLVSPQEAGNVGSVCRLAANFECKDVWLVNPQCDYKGPVGHAMAANSVSRALLENVRVSGTLAEALDECHMGIAFTRRSGAQRIPNMSIADMPLPGNSSVIALVFGREDSGLNSTEVLQCNHICSIPSGKWEGSLNLSHAVAVVLSRLFDSASQHAIADSKAPGGLPPYSWAFKSSAGSASIGEIENLLSRWTELMFSLNRVAAMASKPEYKAPERFIAQVRKVMQRAAPSCREVAYVQGFLTLVANVASIAISKEQNETGTERPLKVSGPSSESCDVNEIK